MKYTSKFILNGEECQFAAPEKRWQPGANTLLYFPLENNAIDVVDNVSLTSFGTTNYTTVGGVKSAEFTKSNGLYNNNVAVLPQGDVAKTLSMWMYMKGKNISRYGLIMFGTDAQGKTFGISGYIDTDNICLTRGRSTSSVYTPTQNTWINLICTYSPSNKRKLYVNGNSTPVITWDETAPTQGNLLCLGTSIGMGESEQFYGNLSNVIIEDKERTAQEIENYFNQTKSLYGIN